MRSPFRLLLFVVLLSCLTAFNAPAQSTQKQGTGTITGRVTIKDKGVANVSVILYPVDFTPNRTAVARATTDTEGNYRLMGVPAGRFNLIAFAPAMVGPREGMYGEAGRNVTIAEGETVEKIDFALVKGGVITGRVVDAEGAPVIGETIMLSSTDNNQHLNITYSFFNPFMYQTDDRGIYRLYGISPGRYTVSAGQDKNSGEVRVGFGGRGFYARTFYPNVTEEAKATMIEVTEGSEAANIDITLGRKSQSFLATGRILDESNQPVPNIYVGYGALTQDGNRIGSYGYSGVMTDAQGHFRLDGLLPGRYAAFSINVTGQSDGYTDPVPFEITDTDVAGLELKYHRGSSISGVVVIEGTTDQGVLAKLSQLSLGATPQQTAGRLATATGSRARVSADGSFLMTGLQPGKYALFLSSYPPPTGLTMARVERDGVSQRTIEVEQGAQITGVRVILEYGTGSIRGLVRFENGTLPEGARLNVIVRRAGETNGFTRGSAQVDSRGHFLIQGLAPGDYELTLQPFFINGAGRRLPPLKQNITVVNGAEAEAIFNFDLNVPPKEGGNNE